MTRTPPSPRGPKGDSTELEVVYGVHPVQELLAHRPREVERIYVSRDRSRGLGRLQRVAREASIPVTHLDRAALARKLGSRAAHQGVAAQVAPIPYALVGEVCGRAAGDDQALLVLVERVTDAGNLGAIIRTAAAAGAGGVILAREGTAGLGPVAAKASAGAVERVPVARERDPVRLIRLLREEGFTAYVLEPRGADRWDDVPLTGRILVVAGGEERGARPSIVAACNRSVAIPLARGVESLNVAVATGVLLFEAVRQRSGLSGGP